MRKKMEKDYTIPFRGLSAGKHSFEFKINEEFFEGDDLLDVKQGTASVSVELIKETTLMDLHFHLNGRFELVCERCLGNYFQDFEGEFRLVVKFGETFEEETDEVIMVPLTDNRFDLTQYIYEYVNLLLPIKKAHIHIEDCDPDIIGKIETHTKQSIDPRWDALKKLNLK
ncbi:MAG: hypothetical protein DRI88_11330 [Bacteroidetes bacterium]|nr:MAG: hypothetical protein DRI72_01060 [Bacteroidota bacterium]RLD42879.1 MAG: hypothetical protein DRI88_11330 [Bacteroidota bacterium]RLD73425.1 MAG: hypothetical protein DRI87_03990 [Bacteroidota bacterium]RLD86953.1 MAG: hypothetical protein DRJ02_07530 [Bacteroidota bacterium]